MTTMICRTLLACAVLLAACATSHAATVCQVRKGFTAVANLDAWGNDIGNTGFKPVMSTQANGDITPVNVGEMEKACNKNPWCMAFNSNGWLKHTYGSPLRRTSSTVCTYKRSVQDALPPSYTDLVHIGTGTDRRRCLGITSTTVVGLQAEQRECVGVPAQEWKMLWLANDKQGNAYYRIQGTDSLCMQATSGESNGSGLQQRTCVASDWRQHFTFVPSSATFTEDGATKRVYGHVIRLRRYSDGLPSNYCLGIASASTSDGARPQMQLCNGSVAQLFRLAKAYSTYGYNVGH